MLRGAFSQISSGPKFARQVTGAFAEDAAPSEKKKLLDVILRQRTASVSRLADDLKLNGLSNLNKATSEKILRVISRLHSFGIFIVTVGDLENWLSHLGALDGPRTKGSRNKTTWLLRIFERLGDNGAPNYLAPQEGDVWDFIGHINAWIVDESRRVMPALPPIEELLEG